MITKVLIAEDYQSTNISVQKTLQEHGITDVDHASYCDDAFTRITTAATTSRPYDLLITDLYFEDDGHPQQIAGGAQLITAARNVQPGLKVLVFSAEGKPAIIDGLFNTQEIDGYVRKARNDSKELQIALGEISQGRQFKPRQLTQFMGEMNSHQFTPVDKAIVLLLAQGVAQKNIPTKLQEQAIQRVGLSSVEKRLNQMRAAMNFTKNEQLVVFCKEMGII